jgi:hypothetical protein
VPGFVVHVGATVLCSHAGQAQPTQPSVRVLLGGQPAVTISAPWTVAGCAMPPPNAGNGPCVTGQWLTGSTRVLADGQPLIVQSSSSVCTPTGTPMIVVATQTRVLAV